MNILNQLKKKHKEMGELIDVLSKQKDISELKLNWITSFLSIMSEKYNLKMEDLISKDKCEPIIQCRQSYVYLRYINDKKPKKSIGREINRDHSTICSTVICVTRYIETEDEKFMSVFNNFKHLLK